MFLPTEKKILLKRYSTALNRRVKYNSLKNEEKEYHINAHSFFYCYRIMWFNKRNCKMKKADAFVFEASNSVKRKLEKRIVSGFEYDELNFHNFYKLKLKTIA